MEIWHLWIIGMIPVDGHTPPGTVWFRLKYATEVPGKENVSGCAEGDRITLSGGFLRDPMKSEFIGSAVPARLAPQAGYSREISWTG